MQKFGPQLLLFLILFVSHKSVLADEWLYSVTPYVWGSSVDGEAGIRGRTTSIDTDFADIIEFVDSGLSFNLQATNGTWSPHIDVFFVELEDSFDLPAATVGAELEQFVVEAGTGYRIRQDTDLLFGLRHQEIDLEVDFARIPNASRNKSWVDPFIGIRLRKDLSRQWDLTIRGDIGGFGIDSDLTLNLIVAGGYRFRENLKGFLAFRAFDTDFDDDGFIYDTTLFGLGAGLRFEF